MKGHPSYDPEDADRRLGFDQRIRDLEMDLEFDRRPVPVPHREGEKEKDD